MRSASFLLLALAVASCRQTPVAPAPRQIHIVGASAGLPFSSDAAEAYLRAHDDAIAPLVQADGSGSGIARFCGGLGTRFPDLAVTTRAMTPAEIADCSRHGVDRIATIPFGWTAAVLVTRPDGAIAGLTRTALWRAATGTAADWHAIDPALPPTRIALRGPAPRADQADGLFDALLGPGCAAAGGDCRSVTVRTDGAYRGFGASADLVATETATTPGAIGIVPYGYARAHADTLRMLPLDGIAPDPATIAAGRYPARLPLYLLAKRDEIATVPGLRDVIGRYAASWGPGGAFAAKGLIPLDAAAQATASRIVAKL